MTVLLPDLRLCSTSGASPTPNPKGGSDSTASSICIITDVIEEEEGTMVLVYPAVAQTTFCNDTANPVVSSCSVHPGLIHQRTVTCTQAVHISAEVNRNG